MVTSSHVWPLALETQLVYCGPALFILLPCKSLHLETEAVRNIFPTTQLDYFVRTAFHVYPLNLLPIDIASLKLQESGT